MRPEVLAHYDLVPLEQITRHPLNAKLHDDDLIRDLILAHGLYGPIQVQRSTGYIVSGHGRYEQLLGLGDTHTAVQYLDVDDAQALQILADDNEGPRRAGYDPGDHYRLLGALNLDRSVSWSQRDLDRLTRDMDTPLRLGEQTATRTGQREAMLILDAADHAELVRLFATIRQRVPGAGSQGAAGLLAARVAVAVLDGGAGHKRACDCPWCTIARQAGAA